MNGIIGSWLFEAGPCFRVLEIRLGTKDGQDAVGPLNRSRKNGAADRLNAPTVV